MSDEKKVAGSTCLRLFQSLFVGILIAFRQIAKIALQRRNQRTGIAPIPVIVPFGAILTGVEIGEFKVLKWDSQGGGMGFEAFSILVKSCENYGGSSTTASKASRKQELLGSS